VRWLPSVADALPERAEARLGKQWEDITPTRNGEPGIAAGDESFVTISTAGKTVHHRPGGFV
jgi:hypothetical protein